MATVARTVGHNMPRRFTSCNPPVVASRALPRSGSAMIEARTQPGRGIEVTALAGGVRHDVTIGLRCCHNPFADRMATVAIPGRALEHPAYVATLAGGCGMPAGKRETRGHVIEITPAALRCGCRRQCSND